MDVIVCYAIGCLTGLLIGFMLLMMQAHLLKHEGCEKAENIHYEDSSEASEEEDRLNKQFENFLSYNGRKQDDN